jgi:hypothetical protein
VDDFGGAIDWMGGTSMATPAISRPMGLLRQALSEEGIVEPTGAAMKAIAATIADPLLDVDGKRTHTGYGIPSLWNWLEIDDALIDGVPIEGADAQVFEFDLAQTQDLKFVICYLDPAVPAVYFWPFFADLNLTVETPDGTVNRGKDMIDQSRRSKP